MSGSSYPIHRIECITREATQMGMSTRSTFDVSAAGSEGALNALEKHLRQNNTHLLGVVGTTPITPEEAREILVA